MYIYVCICTFISIAMSVLCSVTQSCPIFWTPWTLAHQAPFRPFDTGQSIPGKHSCPGKNTEMRCHALLQGIFPTQGSNPGLPHCRQILHQMSHQGSPRILEWVAYPFSSRSSQPTNQTGVSCIAGGFFTNLAIKEAHRYIYICTYLYIDICLQLYQHLYLYLSLFLYLYLSTPIPTSISVFLSISSYSPKSLSVGFPGGSGVENRPAVQ